jgi:hypothetical protein
MKISKQISHKSGPTHTHHRATKVLLWNVFMILKWMTFGIVMVTIINGPSIPTSPKSIPIIILIEILKVKISHIFSLSK